MRLRHAALVAVTVISSATAICQQRIESGTFKGFVKEQPMLNLTEIPEPIRVRAIRGSLFYGQDHALSGAFIEIRDLNRRISTATTDREGACTMPAVNPGTYDFKATKDQFHSVTGKIIVSPRAHHRSVIRLQLHRGT